MNCMKSHDDKGIKLFKIQLVIILWNVSNFMGVQLILVQLEDIWRLKRKQPAWSTKMRKEDMEY